MVDASAAYEGLAEAWAAGAEGLYKPLARTIVDTYPLPLEGQRILDLGAGTGAVSRALLERGAAPYAVDSAHDMIEHCRAHGIPGEVGDLLNLPLAEGSFDGAIAAFSVSHVDDPVRALHEASRVVRDRSAVVVSVFAASPGHRAKAAIEDAACTFGYTPPEWYVRFKRDVEPLTNTSDALQRCADQAGLVDASVIEVTMNTGVETPEEIVASRLAMAHIAPFVAALPPSRRDSFIAASVAAVAADPQPLRPTVLILRGRVRAT